MSGDGRPLSVRLHEKAGHLEAFAPATAQDFHELADELAALEAEQLTQDTRPGLLQSEVLAETHCRLLKEAIGKPLSTIVGCLFDGPSQAESIAVHVIILEEAAP